MELQAEINLISTNAYPSLLRRMQSIFIDTLFILLSIFLISGLLSYLENTPDWIRGTLFVLIFGVYEPVTVALGGTIGNRLMGIQVRQNTDETARINIIQSYARFFVKYMIGWLSFITIHFNSQRRALHDLAAGSVMIQKS